MPPHHHRDVRGGGARAAVFGVSDGLVTNVSLVLGVAGANPGGSIVRLAGVAGLIAGSFSMAAGEYVSMTAQRELMERELEVERRSLQPEPRGRGGRAPRHVRASAASTRRWPATWSTRSCRTRTWPSRPTPARSSGITPQSLGSPWQAAAASFVTFAAGRLHPPGALAVHLGDDWPSCSRSSWARWPRSPSAWCWRASPSGSPVVSALRQLAVTVVAAGVTFGVGRAIGTGVS